MALRSDVHIAVAKKAGLNIPVTTYFTQPFKVLNITEDPREGVLRLMLMSASPGILDGDDYNIRIYIEKECAFELQTQSYQRLFSMKIGATQNMQVHLQKGSYFKYLPHPVVPHESSNFISSNKIFLTEGCSLIWGEIFTCGRKLNGEVFLFTRYQCVTEIFFNNRLMIKENLLMIPGLIKSNGIGQLEGFTHQATLIFLHPDLPVKELTRIASEHLDTQKQIIYGVTGAPLNGIILRLLGHKAEQLYDCLKEVSSQFQNIKNCQY